MILDAISNGDFRPEQMGFMDDEKYQDAMQEIRRCSERIFNALRGSGLARADFLVGQDGKVWFSEINTIPGLSETSLYPQLFEASGVPYPQVLDELISLALQVHRRRATLAMERAG